MNVAAQANFFINLYGIERALKKLKETGYEYITYQISSQHDELFTNERTTQEIGVCVNAVQMKMAYTTINARIYADVLLETIETYKKMCIQAVKTTACMGCPILAVQPAEMLGKKPEIYEITKEVSLGIFKEMKQVADEVGVQLAFINNHNCYAYGSRIEDLIELTEMFDGKIVIDPMYACQARENEMELAKRAGDKLLAFCVTDIDVGDGNPFLFTGKQRAIMPMMGALNYPLIIDRMKYVNQNAFVSCEYNPVLERYAEFVDSEALMDAFDKLFYKTACLIAGKAN